MEINDSIIQDNEKIIFALRNLYCSHGYIPYRMSKFEEYDLYVENKDFLVSDNVITFTDTDGKLMALKPDVTLSIIKNNADEPDKIKKVYYNENVYRISKGTGSYKEIMQSGVECFGNVKTRQMCEMLELASESLMTFSKEAVLAVSDLDIIEWAIKRLGLDAEKTSQIYKAISEKNIHEIVALCGESENAELLYKLLAVHGNTEDVLPELDSIFNDTDCETYRKFREVLSNLSFTKFIKIDFSVTGDVNYYNGIVFKGFIPGIPENVLSGGQYDKLMRKLGRKSSAVGYAVYVDLLSREQPAESKKTDSYVNIALPKGRLGEKVYSMFADAGYECPSILEPNRKLIFENPERKVRYFWVKPSDVPIYVERGVADIGVAGKDILLEYEPEVFELLDLKKGKCRMAVAAPKEYADKPSETLIVATKFANIAKKYYRAKGRDIDIIHLNGSIEIAPISGLSDVIVDIVETGSTLKENNLEVIDTVVNISARLISNKAAYRFKYDTIKQITDKLRTVTEAEND